MQAGRELRGRILGTRRLQTDLGTFESTKEVVQVCVKMEKSSGQETNCRTG